MPEQIISASGTQYGLVVNSDGSINTTAATGSSTAVSGTVIARTFNDEQIQKLAYSGLSVQYIGLATPGTAESAAAWQIKQFTLSGPLPVVTDILFASGNILFDKNWDARTSGPYS